jgi:hypothetical protein
MTGFRRQLSWESFLKMIPEHYYRITRGVIDVYLLNPTYEDRATGRVTHQYDGCCTRRGNAIVCNRKLVHIKVGGQLEEVIELDRIDTNVGGWGHGSRASFDDPIDENIDFEHLVKLLSPYDIPTFQLSGEKVPAEIIGKETYANIVRQLFHGDVLLISKNPWSDDEAEGWESDSE